MEENWIGLLLNRVMRILVCVLDVMFTFLACFPAFFSVACCIGNHTSFADPFVCLSFMRGTLFYGVDGQ